MQRLIRHEFQYHTIISVTHRLETIGNFDRVVTMEKGSIIEIVQPHELLKRGWKI
jgi:ATP-binding cassette subfamily C (CFTR/MRP) protein 1